MKRGRGQGHRGPVTEGPRRHERTRGGEQTAGRGQGARAERKGGEGALPRELLRIVLVLAGGQRGRESRAGQVPRRHKRASVGRKLKGAPPPSEPPAMRSGNGQGGEPRRVAAKRSAPRRVTRRGPGACLRRACNCVEKRGERAGQEGRCRKRTCDMRATCRQRAQRGDNR